jgi:Heterokaryon incompatibility protein (HET)
MDTPDDGFDSFNTTQPQCSLCCNLDMEQLTGGSVPDPPLQGGWGVESRRLNFIAVKNSGANGCIYCMLLYRACTSVGVAIITEENYHICLRHRTRGCRRVFMVMLQYTPPYISRPPPAGSGLSTITLFIPYTGSPRIWGPVSYGRDILENRRNGYAEIISEWMKDCNEKHDKCIKTIGPLPTRVLDVGVVGDDQVKLHISRGESEPYLALSYCWGKEPFIRSTEATLLDRQKGIPIGDLPPALIDAVQVTRALKIRYLWVDALCIIQDSSSDWRREAGRMDEVYKGAYAVLSAVKSKNVHESFLDARRSDPPSVNISALTSALESLPPIHSGSFRVHNDFTSYLSDTLARSEGNLRTRAWVFQEKLLASRTIYFNDTELSWECANGLRCECMELDDDPQYGKWDFTSNLEAEREDSGSYKSWAKIVRYFTVRDLTYETDRLPALSGVVKQMQAHGAGPYTAGLWRKTLCQDLLWQTGHHDAHQRAVPYRGPSWSWVSLDIPATKFKSQKGIEANLEYVEHKLHTITADILEVSCEPEGEDPTGAVKSGYILMGAPILDFVAVQWDYPPIQEFGDVVISGRDHCLHTSWDLKPRPREAVSCVLIGQTRTVDGDIPQGLVLRRVPGEDEVYERIGILARVTFLKTPFVKVSDPIPQAWPLLQRAPRRTVTII